MSSLRGFIMGGLAFALLFAFTLEVPAAESPEAARKQEMLRNLGIVAVCMGKGVTPDPLYRHDGYTGQPLSRALGSWHEHIYENTTYNREAGTRQGVVNCNIYNIGQGGVSLGGGDRITLTPAGNFVENCRIHDFNRWGRTYKDLIQRFWTMRGHQLRYQNGFDCQGLWVEREEEKELGLKNKDDIEKYD